MLNTLLGIKKSMISTYDSRGRWVGATVVEVMPNYITQIKSRDGKDGYNSVALGIGSKKSIKKPQQGLFKKLGIEANLRWVKEARLNEVGKDLKPGQEISLGEVFSEGDSIKVSATSKGKGFQGGVKRYGFSGGPKTHGQSDRHRAPGSIGSGTTPGRVLKGKKMAGHMGVDRVSYKGLEVISVDKTNNLITIKGSVPGFNGSLVVLQKLGRIKGYTPPPEPEVVEEENQDNQEEKKE